MLAKLLAQAQDEWQLFDQPQRPRILLGAGTCGRAAGLESVAESVQRELKEASIEADVYHVGCLGMCYAEPLVEVAMPGGPSVLYGTVTSERVGEIVRQHVVGGAPPVDLALATTNGQTLDGVPAFEDLPMLQGQVRLVTRNCGRIDPDRLTHYAAATRFAGLQRALEMTPEEVIEEVKLSGLRGRGGAGFPTAIKWGFCRGYEASQRYLICNADEGDPGAFMDRSLLEGDPYAVLEGMIIAAYAIGASKAYIYCRAEYPLAIARLNGAIANLSECGLLGDDILGGGFSLEISVKQGAGAFVCGEETALMRSIEGQRGMPSPRPPFPAESGLFGKPTNINNVETFANIPVILARGGQAYKEMGTEKSTGTKVFALAGKVSRTGLIEVPMGIALRDIVFGIGGGIPDGKSFKGVQTGGPSGGCLPSECLDLPVDYDSLTAAGSIMGSGGMIVLDEDTCIPDLAKYFLSFTQEESCGKCTPCRLGTYQLHQIVEGIASGRGKDSDIDLLEELSASIMAASLCALGKTAPNPVLSTLRYFRDEYDQHIREGKCPAGVCKELLEFTIDAEACTGCGKCRKKCPEDAILGDKKVVHEIIQDKCIKCGICYSVCPFDAILKV